MTNQIPTINDIFVLNNAGPWETKSRASLNVLFGLDINFILNLFLKYDEASLSQIDSDIRGLRSYAVSNIPKYAIGANEWHIIRNEVAIVTKGKIEWTLKDSTGLTKRLILTKYQGIYIPNHILHTYKSLTNNCEIIVIANTLFDPKNKKTHDSYNGNHFAKMFLN